MYFVHYVYMELKGRNPHLRVSNAIPWKQEKNTVLNIVRHMPFVLRIAALSLIIIAIARPRSSSKLDKVQSEGIDIMLTMDVSTSMLARDFTPDRISAAKDIAIEFISQRPSDRMGIVVFAGESYTQCPLTTDRATLINLMKEVRTNLLEDGTAIGNGLATAVARLKDSDAKSRVVILLTDGVNNSGEIAPETAADIAKTYGIRVYAIGVGANGEAPYPVMTPWGVDIQKVKVEIDEQLLTNIANETGGRYFRATDNTKLAEIYSEIGRTFVERLCNQEAAVIIFANYQFLWLLLLIPLFFVFQIVRMAIRKRRIRKFGDEALVKELMPSWSKAKSWVRCVLYSLAFFFFVIGLSRPQIGAKLKEHKSQGAEIMIALDVSNSMLAKDYSPNRLERAKLAISRITDKLSGDRIGLIIFAGSSFVQLPITTDYVSAKMFLNSISTESIPVQGTAIGEAIETAASSFSSESDNSRAIIVISDGENHEDDAIAAAKKAAENGIKVYAIGVGSTEGEPIPMKDGGLMKDKDGKIVVTKLDGGI